MPSVQSPFLDAIDQTDRGIGRHAEPRHRLGGIAWQYGAHTRHWHRPNHPDRLSAPQKLLGPKVRLQPYAGYIHGRYEGLRHSDGRQQDVHILDGGVNVLLDGHQAKITLNYRTRPDFTNSNDLNYRPEATMQLQVIL